MDILAYNNSIGDWFVSAEKHESNLQDAAVRREQQEAITDYLNNRIAMSSGTTSTDNKKYVIIVGVAVLMVVAIIMIK